ncbi:restriction endonuclease subunit S [Runella sp.]|uniref:restriction endonuclease subunit S n=1 Tax=Runella sp. TaxID=1960881 RepID=UPI002639B54D|nr:restriction endonuclease subunit S [Runella sp.]
MTTQIPKLRFPEFEGEWEEKGLGELLEFKNGINASKEQYGKGIKFINVLDILNNEYITHEKIIGSVDVDEKTLAKYPVNYGDILFQRSSETREEVGTACVYLDEVNTATFGGFVIRGKKIGEYEPRFLNKLLKTDSARDVITSKSGGSTRYNVGQETLSSVKLRFPSLPEQTKVANFLTAIDTKIQQLTQKKALLEEYKKGVMQQLLSQKIRFKDENGADYPDWEEKKLGEIAMFFSGGTPLTSKKEFFNGEIPFIRSGEIHSESTEQFITELGLKNSSAKMVKVGDILYALYGATSGEVGISKINGAINQAILCIRSVNNHFYISSFLSHQKENITKTYLQGGQGNLSAEIIKSLLIPLPSLPEQTKIANFLTAIDTKIETVAKQIGQTQSYKKGLLQQLFV